MKAPPSESSQQLLPEGSDPPTSDGDRDLDELIEQMMSAPLQKKTLNHAAPDVNILLGCDVIRYVCQAACESLAKQKSLLRIPSEKLPAIVVGDLHGQFRDLRSIFYRCGDPSKQTYVFLGDYVDRGSQGLEISIMLLAMKIRYPDKVYLLRGNHEDCNVSTTYGFYDECMMKYGDKGEMVWLHLISAFNMLPVCALIGERVVAMHGGLSPNMTKLEDIEDLPRPSLLPSYGLMCDIVWADPEPSKDRGWCLSPRGISFSFDESIINSFCQTNNIDLIIRAHQITSEMFNGGYKTMAGGRLVTIFSSPNYLNMMNDACVLKISKDKEEITCRFIVFRPKRSKSDKVTPVQRKPMDLE